MIARTIRQILLHRGRYAPEGETAIDPYLMRWLGFKL